MQKAQILLKKHLLLHLPYLLDQGNVKNCYMPDPEDPLQCIADNFLAKMRAVTNMTEILKKLHQNLAKTTENLSINKSQYIKTRNKILEIQTGVFFISLYHQLGHYSVFDLI